MLFCKLNISEPDQLSLKMTPTIQCAHKLIREIRFGPQTDDHDYNFKLKHAKEFLEEGNKVRAFVFFRGRSILFKEQGEVLLLRFANDLEEYGKVEQMPALEGKKMFLYLSPKKAGVAKKRPPQT